MLVVARPTPPSITPQMDLRWGQFSPSTAYMGQGGSGGGGYNSVDDVYILAGGYNGSSSNVLVSTNGGTSFSARPVGVGNQRHRQWSRVRQLNVRLCK